MDYAESKGIERVVLLTDSSDMGSELQEAMETADIDLTVIKTDSMWSNETIKRLKENELIKPR